jgi:hypothetical protein
LVYVELARSDLPPSDGNGGWFYDTGGFIHQGRTTERWAPKWVQESGVVEMDSVGSCYLVPADVYRNGARYSASDITVEHVALLAEAREMGYRVFADCDTRVEHAFLPKYGEMWHGLTVVCQ